MDDQRAYHHGDLRAALLAAAEAELAEKGIESFSLRSVAKRAGVSHAAPAHHFGDAQGLLTALAAEGFRRFLAMQGQREAMMPAEPSDQLVAAGLGYVDFALADPALFRLIFGSDRPDFTDPDLMDASEAAFRHLTDQVTAAGGGMPDVAAVWAMAHGLADLLGSGRLKIVRSLPPDLRDEMLGAILRRSMRGAV